MRKLFIGFLVFMISFSIMSPILSVSAAAVNTSMSRYQTTANRTISQYVRKLENAQYTDTQILSALTKLKNTYTQKKYLSNYRWTRKTQIDTIIIALNNAISDLNTNDDIYDDFNHVITTTTPPTPSCSYDTRTCSDGSTVRRAGPYCQFATCPTTIAAPVVTNNITSIYSRLTNWVIKTFFNAQNQNSFYKEYDVYLYTPTQSKNGIPGVSYPYLEKYNDPVKFLYDYYSSYTITTSFLSETNTEKVKNLRVVAESPYSSKVSKTSKLLSLNSLFWIFGPLSDEQFNRDAVNTSENGIITNKANYTTYFLYIAKDNSEAFTISYVQSGIKQVLPVQKYLLWINSNSSRYTWNYTTTIYSINPSIYKTYHAYIYTPSAWLSISEIYRTIGCPSTLSFCIDDQQMNISPSYFIDGYEFNNVINGYSITASKISTVEQAFRQLSSKWTPDFNNQDYRFQFYWIWNNDFITRKTGYLDYPGILETYRTYRLFVADDLSEAYLTEYMQGKK